jgi:hypothetical protein
MGVSRWSDLGPFGPVWLCLIEVEKESCCTRNQKQEQQGKKQIKKQNKTKQKEAGPWIYRRRCGIYKVVKVEREGRLL